MTPIVTSIALLFSFLPILYDHPTQDFYIHQAMLTLIILIFMIFHRLMMPELLQRAQQAAQLRADLQTADRIRADLTQSNRDLAYKAQIDTLTGLLNHGAIIAHLDTALAQARANDEPLAILFFDIDHFKRVNDTYGHLIGDQVLAAVAKKATATLRERDTIGRYGGEEFLVILPNTTKADALLIAERLRQQIAAMPFAIHDIHNLVITISIGIAAINGTAKNRPDLLSEADQALYQAKALGRDRVHLAAIA